MRRNIYLCIKTKLTKTKKTTIDCRQKQRPKTYTALCFRKFTYMSKIYWFAFAGLLHVMVPLTRGMNWSNFWRWMLDCCNFRSWRWWGCCSFRRHLWSFMQRNKIHSIKLTHPLCLGLKALTMVWLKGLCVPAKCKKSVIVGRFKSIRSVVSWLIFHVKLSQFNFGLR